MILQVQVLDGFLENSWDLVCSDTLDEGIELDSLLDCEFRENSIILRAVANQLSSVFELLLDVETLNGDFTSGRLNVSRQTLEGSRLTSSVHTEEGKALTVV